jgi:hypothetical protein
MKRRKREKKEREKKEREKKSFKTGNNILSIKILISSSERGDVLPTFVLILLRSIGLLFIFEEKKVQV